MRFIVKHFDKSFQMCFMLQVNYILKAVIDLVCQHIFYSVKVDIFQQALIGLSLMKGYKQNDPCLYNNLVMRQKHIFECQFIYPVVHHTNLCSKYSATFSLNLADILSTDNKMT